MQYQSKVNEGEVLAVGPGSRDKDGSIIPMSTPQPATRCRLLAARSAIQLAHTCGRWFAAVEVGDKVLLPEYGGPEPYSGWVRSLPQTRPLPAQPSSSARLRLLAAACREELHLFREDDILGVLAD